MHAETQVLALVGIPSIEAIGLAVVEPENQRATPEGMARQQENGDTQWLAGATGPWSAVADTVSTWAYWPQNYAAKGLPIFPTDREKIPRTHRGFYAATTDVEQVARWWAWWPNANPATPTGTLFDVVDLDGPHAPALLASVVREGMPNGPQVETGSGGVHYYVAPTGLPSRTRLLKAGPECDCERLCGVDVKALAGYVLLPGSRTTGRYRFRRPLSGTLTPSGLVLDLPTMPAALLELHEQAIYTPPGVRVELPEETPVNVEGLPQHLRRIMAEESGADRSGQLWHLAGAAMEWGLSDGQVVYLARRHGPAQDKYGGRLDGVLADVLGKLRPLHQHEGKPCDRAGCANPPGWMGDDADVTPEAEDFWTSRELLAHVRAFARARRASPWATLLGVLARVVAATPVNVVLPPLVGGEASLNLFGGLVGGPGSGKDAALAAAADAIVVPAGSFVEATPGSGEGLAHLFMRRVRGGGVEPLADAVLLTASEVDTLKALADRHGATLLPELRKAWMGQPLGFAYAAAEKRLMLTAHSYRLCLLVGVQPARAAALLDDSDAGTPQRFLWMPATDPGAPDVAPQAPGWRTWWAPEVGASRVQVPVCEAAREAVDRATLRRVRRREETRY
jgi:Bifunctional DNA primase/polymerase, N-terminal